MAGLVAFLRFVVVRVHYFQIYPYSVPGLRRLVFMVFMVFAGGSWPPFQLCLGCFPFN
jgi:uncharacterized MAPEG superfamily protein